MLVVKRSKEFDPRDRLLAKLWRVLEPDHFDSLTRILIYIHVSYAEKFNEWDTMFYRNVRADAIPIP